MKKSTSMITIYKPENDYLRATPVDKNDMRAKMLGDFVESEVQSSDVSANVILSEFAKVENNECQENDMGVGNLFAVKIYQDKVTIEIGFENDEPTFSYTHAEFREALEAALAVIKDHDSRKAS